MYRIVHNQQTDAFRVERRGFLGWTFVTDPDIGDYLGFDKLESARAWVQRNTRRSGGKSRRWKVVADCVV